MVFINLIVGFVFLTVSVQGLSKGKLPRGAKIKSVNQEPVNGPEKVAARANCLDDFAKPPGAPGYFDVKGDNFYHFSKVRPLLNRKEKKKWFQYSINRIKLSNSNLESLASLSLPEVDVIIPHGNPIRGTTAVIFNSEGASCKNGAANFITISLNTAPGGNPRVLQSKGDVTAVESTFSNLLYNKKKNGFLNLDLATFQTRYSPAELEKDDRPVFVEQARRLQYVWKEQKVGKKIQRGLVAIKNNKQVTAKLRFDANDKLLQQKNLFGVVQFDHNTNSMRIKELARWSGKANSKDFVITLPTAYRVIDAEIDVNFVSRKVLVSGLNKTVKKRWKNIFIYDYEKGWELGVYKPRGGNYVSYAGISPNGKFAIVAESNVETESIVNFARFSFTSRKWAKISLMPAKK